jgi:hypothetical protein
MTNIIPFRRREPAPLPPAPSVVSSTDRLLIMLNATRERGMTWRDVAAVTETNHGSASGLLSRLHKAGLIARLAEEREGSKVYVAPHWVLGRETEKPSKSADNLLMDDMAAMLRSIPAKCRHQFWHPRCRSCEIRNLLRRYDNR